MKTIWNYFRKFYMMDNEIHTEHLHPSGVFSFQWLMSRTLTPMTQSCRLLWSSGRTVRRKTETARKMRTPRSWNQCHVSMSQIFDLSGRDPDLIPASVNFS